MNYILPFLEVSFFTESTFLEESFLVESTFTEAAAAVESTLVALAAEESVADEDLFALLQAAKEKDTARAKAAILNEFFMLYR